MRPLPDIDVASTVLSTFVLVVAALLAWHERSHRRGRDTELSAEDAAHYARQDGRRGLGIAILVVLAVAVLIGSRIPPRVGPRANPEFVEIWLGVFALILTLLWLALADWVALRRFAGRHRKEIFRERIDLLRRDLQQRKPTGGNGYLE